VLRRKQHINPRIGGIAPHKRPPMASLTSIVIDQCHWRTGISKRKHQNNVLREAA